MAYAWLMLAAADERSYGGNEGYDDNPSRHYSWDNTVPNHAKPLVGDTIILRDKRRLLGASVIDRIVKAPDVKFRNRCPACDLTGIKPRKKARPLFRCHREGCLHEFDNPKQELIEVDTYRSQHEAAWVDLDGLLTIQELAGFCIKPKAQQSIRELDWERFRAGIYEAGRLDILTVLDIAHDRFKGGHKKRLVRVRIGQRKFRDTMLERYGNVCAFSGSHPATVLDAAHLYSYAKVGTHQKHGGLLIRRDLHRLFDMGGLAVHPESLRIDVRPDLLEYDTYGALDDQELCVRVQPKTRDWLKRHWKSHRG